jgi:hypothetical protein
MFQISRIILITLFAASTVAFAQFDAPTQQRYYLLGELAGVAVQVDLTVLPMNDMFQDVMFQDVSGDLFYETTGDAIMVSGSVDQQDTVILQLTSDAGNFIGSITATLTQESLEGSYTPLDSEVTPVNWQIVAVYASLRFQQGRLETATQVPQFVTRASIINPQWQEEAFANNLDFVRQGQSALLEYDVLGWWLEETYDIAYYADDFVSVLRVYNVYGGGAHPNIYYGVHNVGIGQDTVELSLSDALTDEGLGFLEGYVLEQLTEKGAGFVVDGSVSSLSEEDMSVFVVSPQGLHLHFAPYAVAPYVQGTFEVVVPWDSLAAYLRPDNPLTRFL